MFEQGVNEHQNVDLPEAWQLLQGQTKRYVQVSSGLMWLMKYHHKNFISLYLMIHSGLLLVELSSKVRQYN